MQLRSGVVLAVAEASRANHMCLFHAPEFTTMANDKKEIILFRSFHCGSVETNLTRNHEVVGSIPGVAQWVKDLALP